MKGIVIVNQSSNYLTSDIARAFKNSNKYEQVVIITGNPKSLGLSKSEQFIVDTITPYDKKSIVSRFKSWILGTFQIIWKTWIRYRDYEFLLVSNPPTIHLFSFMCSNKFSTLVYDVYPDGIATGGYVKRTNIIFKIWVSMAKSFYMKADHVYAISEGLAKKVEQYCPQYKIEVIPLWANKDICRIEKSENIFIKKYNLSEKFVILYSGNIGKGSNIKILIKLAMILKDNKKIQFVVIGEGMEKPLVEEAIAKHELENILLLPYQPIDFLSHSLSSANLAYVSVENKAANVCIPSKTFNLLNVEVPLLCVASENAEITKLIDSCGIGKTFQEDNITGMADFVESIIDNEEKIMEFKSNIHNIKDDFSYLNASKFVK